MRRVPCLIFRRTGRRGLAPLELILCLPFLLAILAIIINLGIEAKWKLRALAVSRQVVWRQRGERRGENDPRPASWPLQKATLRVIDDPPPPLFAQDPFAASTVVRGPVLRNPQFAAPDSQLFVDTAKLDLSGSMQMGEARIDRGFPIFPKLPGVHLRTEHLLIDSQWRFSEMGYFNNDERRALRLYTFMPSPEIQQAAVAFQQAAQAIISAPFRRDLDVLDRDEELTAWFGPPPFDFHPRMRLLCTLNPFDVHDGPVQLLIDAIQGPNDGGQNGVPQVAADRFIDMYEQRIGKLKNEFPINQAEIDRLTALVEQLRHFKRLLY